MTAVPAIPTDREPTLADVMAQMSALHICVHEGHIKTEEIGKALGEHRDESRTDRQVVHKQLSEMGAQLAHHDGQLKIMSRVVGAPILPNRAGEDAEPGKTKLLNMRPWQAFSGLVLGLGGLAFGYRVIAEVAGAFHKAMMGGG